MGKGIISLLLSLIMAMVFFVALLSRNDITTVERPSSSAFTTAITETETQENGIETNSVPEPPTVEDPETVTETITEAPVPKAGYVTGVPYLSQRPRYPNGCEIVSTVMLLRYLGIPITSEEFITQHLKMGPLPTVNGIGPDPSEVFCGDPRNKNSWGCYAPAIEDALELIPALDGFSVSVSDCKTLDELCHEYVDEGYPVVVWGMLNMRPIPFGDLYAVWYTETGKTIRYNKNQHCLLLVGYDEDRYYFHDPLIKGLKGNGAIGYAKEDAQKVFSIMGMQSIAVTKEKTD